MQLFPETELQEKLDLMTKVGADTSLVRECERPGAQRIQNILRLLQ